MADAFDFQIDTLKFRLAVTDQTPYVRSTAPFRKDQFDTSATVGDQSLTGWWVRGQLSFHRGAGLNYYEVLEGETVLNRFKESEHVKVFDELGEVTLDVTPTSISTFSEIRTVTPYRASGIVWYQTLLVKYLSAPGGTPSSLTPNGGTTATGATVLGEYIYITTSAKNVQRFYNTTFDETIYTHTETLYGIWAGKDRLWMIDTLGDVYAMAAFPTAPPVALSGPICRIDEFNTSNNVSWTDGGGSVFMSIGSERIYAFTPANDGAVAALSAPVVAGILPNNEKVQIIRAHMGLLCIVTNKGVRFASINGDSLVIGPLSLEWAGSTCMGIGLLGSKVYVVGHDSTLDQYGYEFDLTENLSSNSLLYPYRLAWFADTTSSNMPAGVCEHADQGIVWWGGEDNLFETTADATVLYSSGYITTAYHRFGTLDLKKFQKLIVRATGSAGTIQAYRVEDDGTATSLGTLNAVDGVGTFDISLTAPAERLAFKFVLTRDGTDTTLGPTLLGYQVKALPVPERQRILKVPLAMQDKVRLRRGTEVGKTGKAYTDLTTLEALERDQAVVTFTDHRTGETGTAYIDQVDFQADSPATPSSNGFGGIAYVTLRVLE